MTTPNRSREQEWTDALQAPGTLLVKFTAPWCAPCKAIEPHLARLEQQPDTPPLLRVDVEAAPDLAARYGVRAMPTLMLLRDGEPLATVVGLQSYAQLEQFLKGARKAA
jgi:thioredoxin 1